MLAVMLQNFTQVTTPWCLITWHLGLLGHSCSYVIYRKRRRVNGTAIGLAGWMRCLVLASVVLPQVLPAVRLLISYL